jgi:hypothetical protein
VRSGPIRRQSKKLDGRASRHTTATRRKSAHPGRSTDVIAPHIRAEDLVGAEWAEWYGFTPAERWRESGKLWASFLALGGSLDPEPDTQSPFFDARAKRASAAHGRSGVRVIRRR